jgi:hypothetical protein
MKPIAMAVDSFWKYNPKCRGVFFIYTYNNHILIGPYRNAIPRKSISTKIDVWINETVD